MKGMIHMKDLVIMKNKQAVTSSLQVAEVFEKNHRDVLKACLLYTSPSPRDTR